MPSAAANVPFDASSHLQLVDIALYESSLKRTLDYLPGKHEEHISVQARRGVRAELLEAETVEGECANYLRAFVSMGMRGIFIDPSDASLDLEENVIFEIDATFAVLYLVKQAPADNALDAFIRFNCVHNAWPFWRQHVFDALKRGSLPMVAVPFFQGPADPQFATVESHENED